MPIVVACSHCGQHGDVSRSAVGQAVNCSRCRQPFAVPFGSGQLLVEWGVGVSGTRVPLTPGKELTIGRGLESDLMLPGPRVSRRHAIVRRVGDEWRIVDLDSANGTHVDGQRIHEATLATDRHITIGDYVIRVTIVDNKHESDAEELARLESGELATTRPVPPPPRPVLPDAAGGASSSGDTVYAASPPENHNSQVDASARSSSGAIRGGSGAIRPARGAVNAEPTASPGGGKPVAKSPETEGGESKHHGPEARTTHEARATHEAHASPVHVTPIQATPAHAPKAVVTPAGTTSDGTPRGRGSFLLLMLFGVILLIGAVASAVYLSY